MWYNSTTYRTIFWNNAYERYHGDGLSKTFEPKLQKITSVVGKLVKGGKSLAQVLGITVKGFAATTGVIAGLTLAVTAAIWAWKKYGKASYDDTEQIKKLNEAQEKYNSSLKEQNAIKKNYKTYAKYESKGALSTEEMEEQQAAAKALADEYPHLLDYIDDEGNYHLKNTSLIEDEINAKEELLKKNADLYTQQRLSASRGGIYSDTSTRAGAAIKKIQDFSAAYDEDQLKKSGREIDSFGVTFDNSRYKKMMQAFAEGKKYSFDEKDMSNLFAGQIGESNWEEFLEKVQENPELLESQETLAEALDSTGAYIKGGAERVAKAFLQMDKANGQLFSELIKGAAEELSEIRVLQAKVIIENGDYEVDLTAEMKETLAKVAAENVEKQIEEMSDLERFFLSDKKEQKMVEEEAERLVACM